MSVCRTKIILALTLLFLVQKKAVLNIFVLFSNGKLCFERIYLLLIWIAIIPFSILLHWIYKSVSFSLLFVNSLQMQIMELMQLQIFICNLARHTGGKTLHYHCSSSRDVLNCLYFIGCPRGSRLQISCTTEKW